MKTVTVTRPQSRVPAINLPEPPKHRDIRIESNSAIALYPPIFERGSNNITITIFLCC